MQERAVNTRPFASSIDKRMSSSSSSSPAPAATPYAGVIRTVLETDSKFRVTGVTGDLHGLESLTQKSWDYSAPTLVQTTEVSDDDLRDDDYQIDTIRSEAADWKSAFYADHPLIEKLELTDGCNVLVAGGAVGAHVYAPHEHGRVVFEGDVDLFIYGLDRAQADKRVEALHRDLVSAAHGIQQERLINALAAKYLDLKKAKEEDSDEEEQSHAKDAATVGKWVRILNAVPWVRIEGSDRIMLERAKLPRILRSAPDYEIGYYSPTVLKIRNKRCLTLKIAEYHRVQIIFRLYSSKSEILHGFDLGTSAVGFDGENVLFTSLGKFTYEYRCLIADTSRRSTTFEARLYKYWRRGFSIVLPHLNVDAMRTEYFKWRLAEVADLPMFPFAYSAISNNRITVEKFLSPGGRSSDYGPKITNDNDVGEHDIVSVNMTHILQENDDLYYFSRYDEYSGLEIHQGSDPLFAGPPYITLSMVHELYNGARAKVYKGGKLDMGIIRRLLPGFDLAPLAAAICSIEEPRPDPKRLLDAAFEMYRTRAVAAYEKMMDGWDSSISWITENPGTQLTSSINPIIEHPSTWYGPYFKPAAAMAEV